MSKDIIVLMPNGRRQKVHCTPDTSILQVLEDVCQKQGYVPTDYNLKHYNKILDLTNTIRFSNLPNKATLEMVEAEKQRTESNVTIGLLLEDGERKMGDFPPNTSLYEVIVSLAPTQLESLQNPSILYTRQEVTGLTVLKAKTLRQLGLIGGRAILRLLNKGEEAKQANVSAVYGRQNPKDDNEKETNINPKINNNQNDDTPGPSSEPKKTEHTFDVYKLIKTEKCKKGELNKKTETYSNKDTVQSSNEEIPMDIDSVQPGIKCANTGSNTSLLKQDYLERRLKIEEEVTFVGAQKAIVFMNTQEGENELEDLPDDFYELTIDEVRKLYHDLQQQRIQLENTPLMISAKKEELEQQTSGQRLTEYKNAVVRIQFPDQIILQGVFSPTNTIEDIRNLVKGHLQNPDQPFEIFTTPLKETIDPKKTLIEAKYVPCVHMHFKWLQEEFNHPYLKKELYSKQTSSEAAAILASKYRAPSKRKINEESSNARNENQPSTSKSTKQPKWFK